MKSFILKTIGFITVLFGVLIFIVLLSNNIFRKNVKFNLSKDTHAIIIGHSHPEMAYNDSLIDGFKNLGHSAESYFYSYYKLKEVVASNSQITSVYLEFSNNQIESTMDDWIWGDEFVSFRYPIYGAFIDSEGQQLLATKNTSTYLAAISKGTYNTIEKLAKKDFNILKSMGGYEYTKRSALDSVLKTDFEHTPQYTFTKTKLSKYNLIYAQKIIAFCKENNLEITLIRSPQHKRLPVMRNEKYYQRVKDSLFSDLKFLDFNDFELSTEEFSDLDHLNYKGARRFSKYFNAVIQAK